ncbi:serine/threonine-protein phosphatase 6 regulatory ankyrin repeat subunit B-like isoform X2 [Lineus longissimus]|uniref:serine/threonine-protein phosphatase 6 regulatory ankyrin repeat subunit B-like isoform X2 n=1 Tax=Lineus longissimus TaxID=88925 RepID=UPI00315D79C0
MGNKYSHHSRRPRINPAQIPWLLRGAIRSNNIETLQYLLSHPHEVNPSMVIDGYSPINLSIELGHVQIVKMLIKAGCNLRQADAPIYPLLQAAIYGRPEIVEMLIKSGCDINTRNESDETAMHLIAQANSPKHVEVASILVAAGFDVNALDQNLMAPLHIASFEICREIVKSPRCNLNIRTVTGDTPLKCAIRNRQTDTVEVLLEKGCSKDEANLIGETPLMLACESGVKCLSVAQDLVCKGANMEQVDNQGMTALHHAAHCGQDDMVTFLIRSNCKATNKQDKNGRTPLYLATSRGHTSIVQYLISKGADISIPNKEEKSPLYVAAYFGHLEIVTDLLAAGADINQSDSHNKTALYVATYHGRTDIVRTLIRNNAHVNRTDKNGKSPLYIAVLHGNLQIAELLIKGGANVNWPDKDGLVPLHMAVKFPKLDIPMVKVLLSAGCDPLNLYSFTQWLLVNNIIPEDCIVGDEEFNTWIQLEKTNVVPLKMLCRSAIQTILGQPDTYRSKVQELPIPTQLKHYLSLKPL